MIVLALDVATKTGWCVDGPATCPPRAGVFALTGGADGIGRACYRFSEWLCQMFATWKPEVVSFEAPLMGGHGVVMNANTARLLISLCGHVESCAHGYGIRCLEEHVQSVRKSFLGHGRPDNPKKAVVERCKLLGWSVTDHNAADAVALWTHTKLHIDKAFRVEAATPMFSKVGS